LQHGYRGLEGGTSLYRLLRKHRQIPGHRPAVRRRKLPAAGKGRRRFRIHFPDEVLARYRAGELDTGEVAELCGVSYPVAVRELRRAGVEIRPRGRPRGTRPAQHADIIRRYRQGESLQQVARELGLSRGRVATVLKRYGVARRAPGPDLWKKGMSPTDRKRLAEHLTGLRRAAGLTQDELSARSGLTQFTLSNLENGRQCPTRRTMARLAKGLGVRLQALEPEDGRGTRVGRR
jgi:transcriptional regulator with XRE-family HTH domain